MNILMLAPEPFLSPRGTPLSIYFRIKALSDLGHEVHLITYPLGEDVKLENLTIHRIPNLFSFRTIKIGPSFAKILLDLLLFFKAISLLRKTDFDLIFSHEEAAWIGTILAKLWKRPHIYDMHSSLPQQLEGLGLLYPRILKRFFIRMEDFALKHSEAVAVICDDLLRRVSQEGYGEKTVLFENFMALEAPRYSQEKMHKKRQEFAPRGEKIVLYTGNFQPYQGLTLLLNAAAEIKDEGVVFVLAGGGSEKKSIEKKAKSMKIEDKVHLTGVVSPDDISLLLSVSDILVSPRLSGPDTPFKIYAYLKSGKPIVATDIEAHRILNDKIAILVKPTAESMAEGISFALFQAEAKKRANAAKEWAEGKFTYSLYLDNMKKTLKIALGESRVT